jgi:hypothetical protein
MTVLLLALAAFGVGQAASARPGVQPAAPIAQQVPAPSDAQLVTTPQVVTPAPVFVPQVPASPAGVILWRNIENGMSLPQLRALYPAGPNVTYKPDRTVLSDVVIVEGCQAKVNVMHPAGVVKEIVMRGDGSLAGRCSLKVITALSGKYGQPDEKDQVFRSILAREGKNYVWTRDGITLQFKRYTNGALGGGGLFAASWELRYSANALAIDL